MTEKDAVKCYTFGEKNWWYLPVDAEFTGNDDNKLVADIMQLLKK
jgi:tetraacyldisaccharide 4'-kinase